MEKPMRVALIGLGQIARTVYGNILRPPKFRLVAVVDKDLSIANDFSKRFRVPSAFTDLDTLHTRVKDIEAILICAPSYLHYSLSMRSLCYGWHVFCEKPMALSIKHAANMIREADRRNLVLQIGHVVRFQPEYLRAHSLVKTKFPNQVVTARVGRIAALPESKGNWYLNPRRSGGVIVDLGIHDFDFLIWTLGSVRTVHAKLQHFDPATHEITVLTTLRFASKSTARIVTSWSSRAKLRYYFDLRTSEDDCITYYYPQKTVTIRGTGTARHVRVESSNPYADQVNDFHGQITGLSSRSCLPVEAFDALRVCLAATQCIESETKAIIPS